MDPVEAAQASLPRLALRYHAAIGVVCECDDYDLRKPLERYAAMLWALGNYRFHGKWQRELRKFDWPTPVSQRGGGQKTMNPWDVAA